MHTSRLLTLLLSSSIALSLAGCGGDDDNINPTGMPPPAPPAVIDAGDTIVLTASGRLLSFNLDAAGTQRTSVAITGLDAGESMLAIDYRPADGQLYGVSSRGRRHQPCAQSAFAVGQWFLDVCRCRTQLVEPHLPGRLGSE